MTHLSMEQLLALREPGLEPGVSTWREHVDHCDRCRAELDRLDQRVARLKALPTLAPSRDLFAGIQFAARADRRRRRLVRAVGGALALAAGIALAVVTVNRIRPERQLVAVSELQEIISRSQELERALSSFDPDRGVVDGRTVGITTSLENRLAGVDRRLEMVSLMDPAVREREAIRLWRERVGLLDALMDVRLTRARYVGF
jgi:hypothetical protein